MSVLDSLFAKTSGKASTPTRFTFNSEGILAPLTSLATAGRRSLSRSNSFSGLLSVQRQDAPQKPKTRQTIHGDVAGGVSLASAMSESVLGQRRTQRSHTDPGRSVQLVFHGPYGGDGAPVSTSMSVPAGGAKGGAPRRPSFMDMGFSLPSMPVADEKESPRMSRDTTMTPNTACGSLESSKGESRAVRFRQTITEVEVTTPYGVVYDGVKPMCFDFDRWGRKIYHFFPNEDDPGMEQVNSDDD